MATLILATVKTLARSLVALVISLPIVAIVAWLVAASPNALRAQPAAAAEVGSSDEEPLPTTRAP
jgi:hypothetical protein